VNDGQGTRIAIRGVPPYDGEYELDLNRAWTTREWNWIKRISGYMPFTVNDGLRGGDPDLFVALAVIGMVRNQKIDRDRAMDVAEALMDVPYDGAAIQLVVEEETDQLPLDLTTEPEPSSPNGTPSKSDTSGSPSSTSSAPSETTPASTGTTGSGSQDISDPATLVRQPQQT
jgi:hypothetical protein